MVDSRAAARYVKSLLELAVDKNVLEEVHKDMLLFSKIVRENKPFELLLGSPIIKHDKKRDVLEALFKGKVNALTMSILDILTKKNREPLLPAIAAQFHNAYNEYKQIGKATVTTAVPLDDALRTQIRALVQQLSKKSDVDLTENIDKNMIGGFVLNVGDRQIDASLKNKLKSLQVKFSHNPYIKEF
ncbi:ATP synthase F1 subunit delta [Chryseolinea sp. T2]|uniref:ATP synthase F1 subunit delta n=1 Tax=Chryseolinea sp. T2 TaxID=3129255 RepID=UPI003077AFDB